MMTMRSRISSVRALSATLVFLAAATAHAADVRVTYDVDEKPLKAAVSGTPLTFTLYSDGACTTVVTSQVVPVDAVVPLEKIKAVKPKGGVNPPKIVRLNHVLSGVAPAFCVYLPDNARPIEWDLG